MKTLEKTVKANTPRHSGTVQRELEVLATEYEDLVRAEMEDLNQYQLITAAAHCSSRWSGGHCITNMVEQIQRNEALRRLDHL